MLTAKIEKFAPVCNNYVKGLLSLPDGSQVWSLVPLVGGQPLYGKGSSIAYVPGPLRLYKGHEVRGTVADPDLLQDEESYNLSKEWGL